jgi:hypothetical protein
MATNMLRSTTYNPRDTTLHFFNGIWVLRFLNHFLKSLHIQENVDGIIFVKQKHLLINAF